MATNASIAKDQLVNALTDLSILAGDRPLPEGATYSDVAGTAAANLYALSRYVGRCVAFPARLNRETGHLDKPQFPSPRECMEEIG